MDNVDHKILSLLQENARMSNSEIARRIGMVPSGVLERIRKLEENVIIKEYSALVNPEKVCMGLLAFVFVRTSETPGCCEAPLEFAKQPQILEVHNVAGEDCYLLKIRVKDTQELAEFMREKIGNVETVISTKTVIVLETTKETSKIYLPDIKER
ncbi:Lrp/AsnC family transcriptional regulator [candidate division KSB1 bacterium]